jgi:hypothetical protein
VRGGKAVLSFLTTHHSLFVVLRHRQVRCMSAENAAIEQVNLLKIGLYQPLRRFSDVLSQIIAARAGIHDR